MRGLVWGISSGDSISPGEYSNREFTVYKFIGNTRVFDRGRIVVIYENNRWIQGGGKQPQL